MKPGKKDLTVIACVIGVALAILAGNTPAQPVPIPKTPADVPGPAPGTAMTKEYVRMVGRMSCTGLPTRTPRTRSMVVSNLAT